MFKRLLPLSVLILSIGTVAVPASAKDTSNYVKPSVTSGVAQGASSESVTYGDLDVTTTSGARALLARIKNAAENLCGYYAPNDLVQRAGHQACVRETVSETVVGLDNPVLTALANGQASSST